MPTTYRHDAPNDPPPHDRPRCASSLEAALPGELLDLDPDGNVRARPRRAGWHFVIVSALATLLLAGGAFFTSGIARTVLLTLAALYAFVTAVHYFGHLSRRAVMLLAMARDASLVEDVEVTAMMRYELLTSGFGVLGLVGWHARQRGNDALADRAIEAERAKPQMTPLQTNLPALHAWLQTAGSPRDARC